MPTITFSEAVVDYPSRRALGPLSTELSERRIGVIGPNGGGKSTFVRLINGLEDASSGSVTVDDTDPSKDGKKVRRQVGFVFSDADNQIVMPTVGEDVSFSLRQRKVPVAQREAKVRSALAAVGLDGHYDDSAHTLSGGQKQLLALTSVLVLEPELIIADEPTTLLDLRNRRKLRAVFEGLSQQLIVVTHDLDILTGFDRVICIENGQIVDDGDPDEVVRRYLVRMEP